jgi:hypothetical protein
MARDAATVLCPRLGRLPYAIQLYGHHAWRAADGNGTIDLDAANAALPRAQLVAKAGGIQSSSETVTHKHDSPPRKSRRRLAF